MTRSLALFLALILTTVSIATTGFAAELSALRFEVSASGDDRLQLALRRDDGRGHTTSSSFRAKDLAGLDPAVLRASARQPIQFSLAREAGRLDCSGWSAERRATGNCRFAGDPAFAAFLAARGVSRPSEQQLLDMTIVGTRRTLVEALAQARFRSVTPGDLVAMTALNVTPEYIREMAAHGYRPVKAGDLIPLKALDVSPAYIRSLSRVGYGSLPAEELIQLKALNVTADFIAGFQRAGFRDLPVSRLIQLKALNIRPEELARQGRGRPAALFTNGLAPLGLAGLMP